VPKGKRSLAGVIKEVAGVLEKNPDKRAAASYALLFAFLLASTLLTLDYTMKLRNPARVISQKDMNTFMSNFYSTEAENIKLPETKIRYGADDAKITISVFTDFLCNACYNFYQTEKYIVSRFGGKVKFMSYHYPLDSNCNKNIDETVYANSCLASKVIEAATEADIFDKFTVQYFKQHKEISHDFTLEKAFEILDKAGFNEKEKNSFKEALASPSLEKKIAGDIKAATELKIDGTPTIFLNGRRISGVPPKEMLEALIEKELKTLQ
jgi:predicted DsbA family dithiol-disulfide isomerase